MGGFIDWLNSFVLAWRDIINFLFNDLNIYYPYDLPIIGQGVIQIDLPFAPIWLLSVLGISIILGLKIVKLIF